MLNETFQFLPGLGNSYSTKVRSHLIQRHHRLKSTKNIRKQPSSGVPCCESRIVFDKDDHHDVQSAPELALQVSVIPTQPRFIDQDALATYLFPSQLTSQLRLCDKDPNHEDDQWMSPPPRASFNFFDSLSVESSRQEQFLVHSCESCSYPFGPAILAHKPFETTVVNSLGSPLYIVDQCAILNPPRDISFRHLVDARVGLVGMATAGAYEVAFCRTGSIDKTALQLETQTLALLADRLSFKATAHDKLSMLLVIAFICRDSEALIHVSESEAFGEACFVSMLSETPSDLVCKSN